MSNRLMREPGGTRPPDPANSYCLTAGVSTESPLPRQVV